MLSLNSSVAEQIFIIEMELGYTVAQITQDDINEGLQNPDIRTRRAFLWLCSKRLDYAKQARALIKSGFYNDIAELQPIYAQILKNLGGRLLSSLFIDGMQSRSPEVRAICAEALVKLVKQPLQEYILSAFMEGLRDYHKRVRQACLKGLSRHKFTAQQISELSKNPYYEVINATVLNEPVYHTKNQVQPLQNTEEYIVHFLVSLTTYPQFFPPFRISEILDFLNLSHKSTTISDVIIKLSQHEKIFYRELCIQSIEKLRLDSSQIRNVLQKLLYDDFPQIRKASIKAIGKMKWQDSEIVERLITKLTDREWEVRIAAIGTLLELGIENQAVIDVLKKAMKSSLEEIRIFSIQKVKKLANKENLLPRLVQRLCDQSPEVRKGCADILQNIGWNPDTRKERLFFLLARQEWLELFSLQPKSISQILILMRNGKIMQESYPKLVEAGKKFPFVVPFFMKEFKKNDIATPVHGIIGLLAEIGKSKPDITILLLEELIRLDLPRSWRKYLFRALQKIENHSSQYITALCKGLQSCDSEINQFCIVLLRNIAAEDPNLEKAINVVLQELPQSEAVQKFFRYTLILKEDTLDSKLKKISFETAMALKKIKWSPDVNKNKIQHLQSVQIYQELNLYGKRCVPTLLQSIKKVAPEIKRFIFLILSEIKDSSSLTISELIENLIKLEKWEKIVRYGGLFSTYNTSWDLRKSCYLAISSIGAPAIPSLLSMLKSVKKPSLIRAVAIILANIGKNTQEVISALLQADEYFPRHYKCRAKIIEVLGDLQAVQAIPEFVERLSIDSAQQARELDLWEIRKSAAQSLGKIGKQAQHTIPKILESLNDYEWRVRLAALDAIAQISPQVEPFLNDLFHALRFYDFQVAQICRHIWQKVDSSQRTQVFQALAEYKCKQLSLYDKNLIELYEKLQKNTEYLTKYFKEIFQKIGNGAEKTQLIQNIFTKNFFVIANYRQLLKESNTACVD